MRALMGRRWRYGTNAYVAERETIRAANEARHHDRSKGQQIPPGPLLNYREFIHLMHKEHDFNQRLIVRCAPSVPKRLSEWRDRQAFTT